MAAVFDPNTLFTVCNDVARRAYVAKTGASAMLDELTGKLSAAYPEQVYTGPRHWITNKTGDALGKMALLHASFDEYLLIWSTAVGTAGYSGRYRAVVRDIMLRGEMRCSITGDGVEELTPTLYSLGGMAVLNPGQVKEYSTTDGTIMLEYGVGNIPSMLPQGLVEIFTSTLDKVALRDTLEWYGRFTVSKLLKGRMPRVEEL